jgi:signal transduction histidine kinase
MQSAHEVALSDDPDVLRAALNREIEERRRADSIAKMQTDVVKLAIDLVVHDFDIERLFGGLTKNMVEQTDSHVCAVWLLDNDQQRCDMWMAYVVDQLYTRDGPGWETLAFPHESLGRHLMAYTPGWISTIEYGNDDPRLPGAVREFHRRAKVHGMIVAPLRLGGRTLGWIKLSGRGIPENDETQWWRVVLIEAIARQAALALHRSRLSDESRLEERRKSILEERNRLARDIHDNLAQGFAAILMQLQAAQRECRSVVALRPSISDSGANRA